MAITVPAIGSVDGDVRTLASQALSVETSTDLRISTASSTDTSATTSLDTRVSSLTSTDLSSTSSLDTRVSAGLSVDVSATTSLDTRVSSLTSTDLSSTSSLDTRVSSLTSTDLSSTTSIDTRIGAGLTLLKKTLTADHTTITAAAAFEAINIDTALPANSRIVGVSIHTVTAFSGGTVGDFTVDIGTAGDDDAIVDGSDLFAAAVDGQAATRPLGIAPNKFFAAGGQLVATFRCGSDDVGDATAGSCIIDVLYTTLA